MSVIIIIIIAVAVWYFAQREVPPIEPPRDEIVLPDPIRPDLIDRLRVSHYWLWEEDPWRGFGLFNPKTGQSKTVATRAEREYFVRMGFRGHTTPEAKRILPLMQRVPRPDGFPIAPSPNQIIRAPAP